MRHGRSESTTRCNWEVINYVLEYLKLQLQYFQLLPFLDMSAWFSCHLFSISDQFAKNIWEVEETSYCPHIIFFRATSPPPYNIIPYLFMILNLTLLSVVWQTCSWTDQDSEAQTRYQLISLWCRVHRSHAQCWMDYWQWLGWAKNYAISKLDTCSIVLGISLCSGGKWRLIFDITSKRDYILADSSHPDRGIFAGGDPVFFKREWLVPWGAELMGHAPKMLQCENWNLIENNLTRNTSKVTK